MLRAAEEAIMTTVRDIMHRRVARIHPDATLAELVRLLAAEEISGVPVVDADCVAVGVVSAKDIMRLFAEYISREAGQRDEAELLNRKVRDIMTPFALSVPADLSVTELSKALLERGIHRALAMDQGRLCGIVTAFDVLRASAQ
jgi:CBS domain-containing protein